MDNAKGVRNWIFAAKCKKNWLIFSSRDEIPRDLEKADRHLAELEAQGLEDFSCTDDLSSSIECVRDICNELKLTRGVVTDSKPPRPTIALEQGLS